MQFSSTFASLALAWLSAAADPELMALLKETPSLSTLAMMAGQFPEVSQTISSQKNITILAPSNDAFMQAMMMPGMMNATEDAIMALLTYHILDGTYTADQLDDDPMFLPTLMPNYQPYRNLGDEAQVVKAIKDDDNVMIYGGLNKEVKVTKADVKFNGGVIHMVDKVLTPPMMVSQTALALNQTGIATALNSTMMVDKVDMMAKTTVFVPNNEAFASMKDTLATLKTDQIAKILEYHVVPDTIGYSTMFTAPETKVKTVNGESLTIREIDDKIYVNNRMVVVADIITNTGVIHVIDGILLPDQADARPNDTSSDMSSGSPSNASGTQPVNSSSGVSHLTVSIAVGSVAALVAFGFGVLA